MSNEASETFTNISPEDIDRILWDKPKHELTEQYREERFGHRVEWTDGRNRCKVTDLPIWTNDYRLQFLDHFDQRILKEGHGFLTIEIDMRLLKLFNDKYGETTANKALVQFTTRLIEQLNIWTEAEAGAEYYLYKMRDGGDDYSLGISGSTQLLEQIMRELPSFLDAGIAAFTDIGKTGEKITTPLGAECGMSLIAEQEDVRASMVHLQEEYEYDYERRRDPSKISGIDLDHDLVDTHRHVATAELSKSKYLQIFTELEQSDSEVRKVIAPARELLKPILPDYYEDLIISELTPPPEQIDSMEELKHKVFDLRQKVMFRPLDRIHPIDGKPISDI